MSSQEEIDATKAKRRVDGLARAEANRKEKEEAKAAAAAEKKMERERKAAKKAKSEQDLADYFKWVGRSLREDSQTYFGGWGSGDSHYIRQDYHLTPIPLRSSFDEPSH